MSEKQLFLLRNSVIIYRFFSKTDLFTRAKYCLDKNVRVSKNNLLSYRYLLTANQSQIGRYVWSVVPDDCIGE